MGEMIRLHPYQYTHFNHIAGTVRSADNLFMHGGAASDITGPMRQVPVRSDPWHILWHYANGRMPDFVNKQDGPVGWVRWTHRGIQPLDEIAFPESQRRYIFSKKFELLCATESVS